MRKKTIFHKKKYTTAPIWLMRQAGRYLPEYREQRKKAGSFLDLCYNPEFAAIVTSQPIERFDFDAAIIFSDILVILNALGVNIEFKENIGPIVHWKEISELNFNNFDQVLEPVYQAINVTSKQLSKDKTLIGFAGAPWTLATYYIEGKTSKDFSKTRIFAYNNEQEFINLLDLFTEAIIKYTKKQIENGAEVIKIFDSWSGVLSFDSYQKFVINPNKKIVNELKKSHPDIDIICFPKGSGVQYLNFVNQVKPDILALDYTLDLDWAVKNLADKAILQGNLDPCLLASNNQDLLKQEVINIIDKLGDKDFIFNLGHGILPTTPIENVEFLIDLIRNYK